MTSAFKIRTNGTYASINSRGDVTIDHIPPTSWTGSATFFKRETVDDIANEIAQNSARIRSNMNMRKTNWVDVEPVIKVVGSDDAATVTIYAPGRSFDRIWFTGKKKWALEKAQAALPHVRWQVEYGTGREFDSTNYKAF